ncbi:hypothetical protein NDU88_003026 [Pleurodeles waltl]|uniref:Uncharacterized protein n=1 Tax=Pleurodeles waltl TaxID=8319 RepID=A0AAV7W3T8_PLEWA|nr:hypothetical protein NDU88_003026 [Pleurodeles waltl]
MALSVSSCDEPPLDPDAGSRPFALPAVPWRSSRTDPTGRWGCEAPPLPFFSLFAGSHHPPCCEAVLRAKPTPASTQVVWEAVGAAFTFKEPIPAPAALGPIIFRILCLPQKQWFPGTAATADSQLLGNRGLSRNNVSLWGVPVILATVLWPGETLPRLLQA